MADKDNPDPQNNKRKRLDVTERRFSRKSNRELVVKASLSGKLIEKRLLPEIDKWVSTVSKAINKASLLFNRTLMHCLENNIDLPDLSDQTLYLQCVNIGLGRLNKPNPLLQNVWDTHFSEFPPIEKNKGDTQAYVYASKNYMTVFKNSLLFTFESRQKLYLRKWISENGLEKETIHPIRCAINGWTCKSTVPNEALQFVENQKQLLDSSTFPKEGLTMNWLKTNSNSNTVVRYFWHILKYLEQFEDTKRFSIAPISRIKSHFITIDTKVLYNMMKNVGLFDKSESEKAFRELRDEHFHSVFNLAGKKKFTHLVQTDGVSICVHFQVPKVETTTTITTENNRVISIDPGRTNLVSATKLPTCNAKRCCME